MNAAAAILNHYFRALAQQSGMRWTAANAADIERACDLLADAGLVDIPTFAQATPAPEPPRETISFERPLSAEERRDAHNQAQIAEARRMLRQRQS